MVLSLGLGAVLLAGSAGAQDREPISASGHGGFFDAEGKQVPLTLGFATQAQRWYRDDLLRRLDTQQGSRFLEYEKKLSAGPITTEQERLVAEQQALEWLIARVGAEKLPTGVPSKLRALGSALRWELPIQGTLRVPDTRAQFRLRPDLRDFLKKARDEAGGVTVFSLTNNSGQAYIDECAAAGVPIPPTINVMDPAGLAGWKSQGFIPTSQQFIVGTPAEVRTYQTADGMCIALPRYTSSSLSTVMLDGVICMGKTSSKVCFWDNQWTVGGIVDDFTFAAGEQIPIGVPAVAGGKYQAGGKEIEFGPGNVCTDCHAGENPYIIHPDVNLATSGPALLWESLRYAPQNLPTMAVNRYDPLVGGSWPQNQLSQAGSTVPEECSGCHVKGGAGRFPHLSNQLPQYCSTILAQAITKTMPQGSPGSAAAAANAFRNMWCGSGPSRDSADAGDPHLTTINKVHYDFQAAGEFTALRNEDTGFELQTRQSPVVTSFIPGADSYTGLASCVSLNTAVALRAGKVRVTYQGGAGERPTLRIDGKVVFVAGKLDLGGGNVLVQQKAESEVQLLLADGTQVTIVPLYWSSQGYWYLDVHVRKTTAREGIMGPILAGEWLPRAPDGTSFGPRPVALLSRHIALNHKFADAWRVSAASSLFDYGPGLSTEDHTDRAWPAEPGKACTSTGVVGPIPVVKEPRKDLAAKVCQSIGNAQFRADCIFDVTVMGDAVAAQGHLRGDQIHQ
jgi:hypothetical protein